MKYWTIGIAFIATASAAGETLELVCELGQFVNTETNEVYSSSRIFRLKIAIDGSNIETEYDKDSAYEDVEPRVVIGEDTIFIMYEFYGGLHKC